MSDEQAVENRERPRAYTFNAPPPHDYEGPAVLMETIRLGDHAHITVSTGWVHPGAPGSGRQHHHAGHAGRLIFSWRDWLRWRDQLEAIPSVWLCEVELPSAEQVRKYTGQARADQEED